MFDGRKAAKAAQNYINRVNKLRQSPLSKEERINLINWFNGLESLGAFDEADNFEGWTMNFSQNAGTGSKVIGFGEFDATIVNGGTWGIDGITLNGVNQYLSTNYQSSNARNGLFVVYKITGAPDGNYFVGGIDNTGSQPALFIFNIGNYWLSGQSNGVTYNEIGGSDMTTNNVFTAECSLQTDTLFMVQRDGQNFLYTYPVLTPSTLNNLTIGITGLGQFALEGVMSLFLPISVDNILNPSFGTQLFDLYKRTLGKSIYTYDVDAISYINRANVQDPGVQKQINDFIVGLKSLGLWDKLIECWSMRSAQNAGTGTTVYGIRGDYDISLSGGPTWGIDGINFNGSNQYAVSSLALYQQWPNFSLFSCANVSSSTTEYSMIFGEEGSAFTQGNGMIRKDYTNPFMQVALNGEDGNLDNLVNDTIFDSFDLISYNANPTIVSLITSSQSSSVTRTTFIAGDVSDRVGFAARRKLASPEYFATMQAAFGAVFTELNSYETTSVRNLYKNTIGQGLGLS